MDNDGRFPVVPGQTYRLEGGIRSTGITPAQTDVAYYKGADPQPTRVDRNVTMPYTFTPEEGETHAAWVMRAGDVRGGGLYID